MQIAKIVFTGAGIAIDTFSFANRRYGALYCRRLKLGKYFIR